MSNTKVPPDLERVRTTASKAHLACLQMKQAGEELEEALLKLEAQVKVSAKAKAKSNE